MVGVYPADFDAPGALVDARRSMEICGDQQFTVTSMRGRKYLFHLLPQHDSGSPDIVLWSFRADDWACDNAFVAAHNAAIGIATCSAVGGYDVLSLARDALKRIENWPIRRREARRSQTLEALDDPAVGQPVVGKRIGVFGRRR